MKSSSKVMRDDVKAVERKTKKYIKKYSDRIKEGEVIGRIKRMQRVGRIKRARRITC